jgi:hypothetical protein
MSMLVQVCDTLWCKCPGAPLGREHLLFSIIAYLQEGASLCG